MEKFNTIDKARSLFESKNFVGNDNCIFLAYRDTTKESMKYGALGGVLGGAIGGAIVGAVVAFSQGAVEGMQKADGYLINSTESGIGIIPLKYNGVMMTANPSKMEPQMENMIFVKNEDIETLTVKNFNIFNSKIKKIKFVIKGGLTLNLFARNIEKLISYQQDNFSKFVNKYSK